ncbi:nucleoside deaminase [Corynebacterium sp.]|uniref:nucleoside deaminase n=1 Tax=Corynebacterium sp. TaxID=1720 RepID=UPI0037C0A17A
MGISDRNRVVSDSSPLRHPEFTAAEWAIAHLDPRERSRSTVYTSGEHCPMCAAAHGWAGLGRIVYASSVEQFKAGASEDGRLAAPELHRVDDHHVAVGLTCDVRRHGSEQPSGQ